ncbi:MAG: class I SAM-dependent DNA methyltransferase [Erythrobacter sp.]|uniref:class I SAM-dependent DNA methyltransferase n=1 Tax=Erythrobacter sp. TaxID=1042 RepID=UPI001B18A0C7|nr:DNA methyltransferase [Erythrobacter sp.]MBO6768851.1 class I SAM-dependent DNA methyltransferase [Erythrobacter sp.]
MTVEELIAKWQGTAGGAETSNFQPFITDLCEVLGIERPGVAQKGQLGSYEYEASVPGGSFRSIKGSGAIDLYKRGHFIMEAKQSYLKPEQVPLDLDDASIPRAPSGARYDKLMKEAWRQARNYARNLPSAEPIAPFLIVCDVGRAFELYVDPAGNGRDYEFFPDRQTYRIELADLDSDDEVARTGKTPLDLLKAIWTAPKSVDPRFHAAEVTRLVARNLAEVSKYLEEGIRAKNLEEREKNIEIEESSLFLMRVLFCMFAEDIGLLPPRSFEGFLKEAEGNDGYFANGLRDLFEKMNNPEDGTRFSMALKTEVRYFNGGLFEDSKTYPLGGFLVHNLYEAARQNWRRVEPAIFGTLLEQALDAKERAKLGAHYTPRPYVETLVRATIMDVLEPEWEAIEERIEDAETGEAIAMAHEFHEKLAATRVLDPACGTGNFLYVAMELLQALESRVIERILTLGGAAQPKVGPQQFYGLELNPRAAKIAELVLWIGWLRNRLKDDPEAVPEPVLKRSANLNMGRRGRYDALLRLTETGEPDYENPVMAEWPEAEFIVGNPPFIGGKDLRERLGGDYAELMWRANERVPKSADFVMQWWDRAAHNLVAAESPLRRFGFVTTNSITQEFSRRVIASYLFSPPAEGEGGGAKLAADAANPSPNPLPQGQRALSLIMAIPDHPWTKATKDAAAVRIAMTVAERGAQEGRLREVTGEAKLDSDNPDVALSEAAGWINANLTVGADVTSVKPLLANEGLASPGVKLHGAGFIVTKKQAKEIGLGKREGLEQYICQYRNGRDLLQTSRDVMVIDLHGLNEREVRTLFPEVYEHLLRTVKPERDKNREKYRRENWWLFGRKNTLMRSFVADLPRYLVTVETSKHRIFQYLERDIRPDNMLIAIGSEDGFHLGVLQSVFHAEWCLRAGGWLGYGNDNRYNKSKVFDPFPFPDATEEQRAAIAELAEELDATRKLAIAETDKLTMTELYNLREKLRGGEPLSDKDSKRATAARAGIVNRLHEQLDSAVADAYGWGDEWRAGLLGPSEIVARLVALNHERAAEEAEGHIRWLRPDYQIPRYAPDAKS